MKPQLLLIVTGLLCTSCATILKKKTYNAKVTSDLEHAQVKIADSIYMLPAKIKLERSNKELDITLISEELHMDYKVKPSPDPVFLFVNLSGMLFAPVNYAVDLTNHKRFYYGKKIHLDSQDSLRVIVPKVRKKWEDYWSRGFEKQPGSIHVTASVPYINGFNFETEKYGTKVGSGFWGISAGLEYVYRKNRYLGFRVVTASDFFVPVPAPVSHDGEWESMNTYYFDLTDNFSFKRLNIGYGINYSVNTWNLYDDTYAQNEIHIRQRSRSFGITLNSYYQINRFLHIGLIYRPSIWNISPLERLQYEHFISMDIMCKIPLRRSKSNRM